MSFWSASTLRAKGVALVEPFDRDLVDGAAYMLKLGTEYYVTPNDKASNPQTVTLDHLSEDEALPIPPGQFAYLTTYETVHIPTDVLALISIRARVKWKGLVNVSGFHVDPGYWGRLTFTVFNAGPATIHLRQGDPIFLIWFADLDADSGVDAKQSKAPATKMDVSILNHVAGELHSLDGLATKLRETERTLLEKIVAVEKHTHRMDIVAGILGAILVGLFLRWVIAAPQAAPSTATSTPTPTIVVVPPPSWGPGQVRSKLSNGSSEIAPLQPTGTAPVQNSRKERP